jgi:kinetochore protein Mis12/MTW1
LQSLIDDIINSVNNLVYQGISSLENGLFSTPAEKLGFKPAAHNGASRSISHDGPEYSEAKQEIEEGLHKLETLLESTVDKNFDRFEIYVLRNILSVPGDLAGWIRLSHYEVLRPDTMNTCRACTSLLILGAYSSSCPTFTIPAGPCVHVFEETQVT